MPVLSIIVPVYNVETYLPKCVDSILSQTFRDYELILVDDGSSDSSPAICDEYAASDGRICVIHKKNGGLVSARKAGLSVSQGSYIAYVDSDDWIDLNMFEQMMKEAMNNHADMVACGFSVEYAVRSDKLPNKIKAGIYRTDIDYIYSNAICCGDFFEFGLLPNLCNKIIKREVLQDNQFNVDDRVKMGEDAMCVFPTILDCQTIVIMDNFFPYHYRQTDNNSISKAYDPHYSEETTYLYNGLKQLLTSKKNGGYMLDKLNSYIMYIYRIGIEREISRLGVFDSYKSIDSLIVKYNIDVLANEVLKNYDIKYEKEMLKYIASRNMFGLWILRIKKYLRRKFVH